MTNVHAWVRGGAFALLGIVLSTTWASAREPALEAVPNSVLRRRRHAAARSLPEAERPLIVRSGGRPQGEHDVSFRVDSDFYYLTGIDVSGAALVLWREDDRPHEVLLLPRQSARQARWDSPFLHYKHPLARTLGFSRLQAAETEAEVVAHLGDPFPRRVGDILARLRLTKDHFELERLQRAVDITGTALVEAARSCTPGMDEQELDGLIRYVFLREGSQGAGFPSIIGSGPNSTILHYHKNRRVMRSGDLVVCDVGAEVQRYTADVTRTFPVSGQFTERQREVYEAVLAAQRAAIASVRPGVTLADIHGVARRVLEERGFGRYFLHGTSHWLGLDVHDVGIRGVELAPGMVLTVEPGVYIDAEQLGVRIEDDVVVTDTGCRILSGNIPSDPDEIEKLMQGVGLGNQLLRPYTPPPSEGAAY